MTIYYHLPVYKASYNLLIEIFLLTKNFTREYKYTIGESLKKEIIEMITNIYRANSRYAKKDLIQKARENVETIRLFLRLLKDLKHFLSCMNSYLGMLKHYKTYKLRKKMLIQNLSAYFLNYVYISNNYSKLVLKTRRV